MFSIETDIQIPAVTGRSSAGRPSIYPFGELSIGDSFLVPKSIAHKARIAAGAWKARRPGWDYMTRAEAGGLRIWRTA